MKKRNGVSEALLYSSLAAGMVLAAPCAVEASTEYFTKKTSPFVESFQYLKLGYTGVRVQNLQSKLKKLSFYTTKIDGQYGSKTEHAVKAFQKSFGLKVDGIAGPETISKLSEILKKTSSDILKEGATGPNVIAVQKQLKSLGYYKDKIDGKFGNSTKRAVYTFQKSSRLSPDGIVGPKTWKTLYSKNTVTKKSVKIDQINSADLGLIATVKTLIGVPYVWGGTTTNGFDCSGFIKYVFNKKEINIPRTVNEIWNYATHVQKPSVGDIVFFQTYKPGPSHAGIYIGDGKFVHAGSSRGVTISKMDLNYWKTRFLGAKRIVQFQ